MNLEFIKEGNIWVAEFEATSDFNLHIERVDDGLLKVMQRGTTEGQYVDTDIWDAGKPCYKNFDCDVAAFVYPKWIKVISGTEVITASVNFNEGGGSGSGSSDGVKWEYYRIDGSVNSIDHNAISNIFSYAMFVNEKIGDKVFIMPRGISYSTVAAIAGISTKFICDGTIVDTGSWLSNAVECDKLLGLNFDYSFLIPITEEEFYSDNFDYPVVEPG